MNNRENENEHLLLELECVDDAIKSLEDAQERLFEIDDQAIEFIGKVIRNLKRKWFYEDL